MSKIGIIGFGFVGKAMFRLLQGTERNSSTVVIHDPMLGLDCREEINRCDFAFICVPTPTAPDGSCDTSIVEDVINWCEAKIIVIRSTVTPGTTERFAEKYNKRVIFQPEYIGETVAHPLLDHQAQGFSVLGGPIEDTSLVADFYKGYYHAGHRFYFTDARTAELAKYMENAFYATKVTFCNEFFDIAQVMGVDFNQLREVWLADPRISRDHTFVYPDNRGFSGKCLPKDTSAMIAAASDHRLDTPLLHAVMQANDRYRSGDATWQPYRQLFGRCSGSPPAVPAGPADAAVTGPSPVP